MIRPPARRDFLLGASAALMVPLRAAAQQSMAGYIALRDAVLGASPSVGNRIPNMRVEQNGWNIGSTDLRQVVVQLPNPRLIPGPGVQFDQENMSDLQGAIVIEEDRVLLRINVPRFVMGRDIRTKDDEELLDLQFRIRGKYVANGKFEDSTPLRIYGVFESRDSTIREIQSGGEWSFFCDIDGQRAYRIEGSLNGSSEALSLAEEELRVRRSAGRRGYLPEAAATGAVGGGCPFTSVATFMGWTDKGPFLEFLRLLRDDELTPSDDGQSVVARYYASAPAFERMTTIFGPQWALPFVYDILSAGIEGDRPRGIATCTSMIDTAVEGTHLFLTLNFEK